MPNDPGEKRVTPLRAIRLKCLDCVLGSAQEVQLCPSTDCPLWRFRLGKNPNIVLSDEERERRAARGRASAENLRNRKQDALR